MATTNEKIKQLTGRLDRLELTTHLAARNVDPVGRLMKRVDQLEQQDLDAGARVLAKAVQLNNDPDELRKRAESVMDATELGVLEELLNNNEIAQARDLVERAERQSGTVAKADEERPDAAVSGLEGRVERLEEFTGLLHKRLSRVEERAKRRPRPPQAAQGQTVAKGYQHNGNGSSARHAQYRDTPEGLLTRADALFDNPNQVGAINELITSGDPRRVKQARELIERAEFQRDAREGRL